MNEKITLQDLINLFSEKQGISKKDAELFVRSLFDLIEDALAAEKYVKVKGLGTFKLTEVDSRESVNVNTGERIEIQGHTKVSFTPDTTMKDLINKPFAHFETVILNDGVELEDTPVEVPEALEMEEVVTPIVEIPTEVKIPVQEEVSEIVVVNEEVAAEGVVPKIVMVEEPETAESEIVEESDVIEELQLEIGEKVSIPEEIQVPEETPQENHQTETVEVPEEDKRIFIEEKISEEKNVTESKEKSINRVLWGVIVVLVLIILFGVYWMFLRPSDTPEVIPAEVVQEEVVMPISVVEEKKQEEVLKTIQFIELSEEELRKERVPSFADTLDYQIVGTQTEHTLQQGETIIRASVRFFGTKKYWPYIVRHNKDVLKDPDNIPAGIRLKIPKLVEKK